MTPSYIGYILHSKKYTCEFQPNVFFLFFFFYLFVVQEPMAGWLII